MLSIYSAAASFAPAAAFTASASTLGGMASAAIAAASCCFAPLVDVICFSGLLKLSSGVVNGARLAERDGSNAECNCAPAWKGS